MPKFKNFVLIFTFSLFVTLTTVYAAGRWTIGEQFNKKGYTVKKEVSRTGNFYNGLELLEKYSDGTMTIQLSGEKKTLFIYFGVGKSKNVNITGTGALNHQVINHEYTASGTNDVRLNWKQTTDGHVAAFLKY